MNKYRLVSITRVLAPQLEENKKYYQILISNYFSKVSLCCVGTRKSAFEYAKQCINTLNLGSVKVPERNNKQLQSYHRVSNYT